MTCKECVYDEMCFIKHTDGSHACCEFKNRTDLVEVVRCKNCTKWKTGGKDEILGVEIGRCDCSQWKTDYYSIETEADDFCSYGERKEGAN